MIRPPHHVRLLDLTHTQIGALLAAYNRPLRWRYPTRGSNAFWMPEGLDTRIERKCFDSLVQLGLMQQHGESKIGRLTPKGFALAEIAITLSRQIAAGVAGHDARSLLPAVAEEAAESEAEAETPPLRFSTVRTPRDVIGAQLKRVRKEIV